MEDSKLPPPLFQDPLPQHSPQAPLIQSPSYYLSNNAQLSKKERKKEIICALDYCVFYPNLVEKKLPDKYREKLHALLKRYFNDADRPWTQTSDIREKCVYTEQEFIEKLRELPYSALRKYLSIAEFCFNKTDRITGVLNKFEAKATIDYLSLFTIKHNILVYLFPKKKQPKQLCSAKSKCKRTMEGRNILVCKKVYP